MRISGPFRFKQFSVEQGTVTMKVNTDGVLLGCWCNLSFFTGKALDIGTGTGVIALILAQRSPKLQIDALDIDEQAFKVSTNNFRDSPWSNRLASFFSSLQDFQSKDKFHVIITNPPYFVNRYKSEQNAKNIARHADSLPFSVLINFVITNLWADGFFHLILPADEGNEFIQLAELQGLFVTKKTNVASYVSKSVIRYLLTFSLKKLDFGEDDFFIYNGPNMGYTDGYIELTKDFYL